MDFSTALTEIYNSEKTKESLCSPFYLHSRLADLCSDTFEGKRKTTIFYEINKRINIFARAYSGEYDFSKDYQRVSDVISEKSFFLLVLAVVGIVNPENKAKIAPVNTPQRKAATPAVVVKAPEPQTPKTVTPLTTSYPASSSNVGCFITLGVVLAIVIFIVLAIVIGFGWSVWQWIIGIVGGLLLGTVLTSIVAWLDRDVVLDFYVLGTWVVGIFTVLNLVMLLIFGESYKVIFSCFSVIELFLGLVLTVMSFDKLEEGWGACQIIECIITLALLIVGITCI